MTKRGRSSDYASLGVRTAAFFVDLAVLVALALAILVALGLPSAPVVALDRLQRAADGWTGLAVLLYFATLESWGGTAGKRLFSLRVETASRRPVGYLRSLWRNLAKALAIALFPIAIAFVLASESRRSIHDLLSGTVVRRTLRGGLPTGLLTAIAVVFSLAAAALVHRYGRLLYESRKWRTVAAERIDIEEARAALPDLDPTTFFEEQHTRCFEKSYTLGWLWSRIDKSAYGRCLSQGYGVQMAQALVLTEPRWAPSHSPRFGRLELTVRLNKGRLPERVGTSTETECEDAGTSSGSGGMLRSEFKETSPGVYRVHTLVGLRDGSCRVSFSMLSGRWPLAPPLVIPLPTPDPVRIRQDEEARQRRVEGQQRSWQCVQAAIQRLPRLAPVYTDAGTDALSDAVRRLRSSDVSERHNGALALKKLGPEARSAVPELIRSLADTNENSKDYAIQALVAADPAGEMIRPALRCLAEEPTAYVRIRAAAALASLEDPTGVAMLREEMRSPEEHVRISLVQQLRDFKARSEVVLSLLIASLRSDASTRVRVECARTLPWLGPRSEQVEGALNAALRDPSAEVREAAATSIHDLPSIRSRP